MEQCARSGNPDEIALGRALISAGKVGCIVLAGGDGSRLGWSGPKGSFPISLVKQKSLFHLLFERVEAASNHYGHPLKLAVMTSPLNDAITREAFASHEGDASFFSQRMVPMLDEDKNPLDETRPNGNGEVLHQFFKSGIYDRWKEEGVEYLQIVLVDNPLAEPFDPNLIGFHYKTNSEVTLKAVEKAYPHENVGVIGKKEGRLTVVEYSENPPPEWKLANTSLFCFSLSFVEKIVDEELPVHIVTKFIDRQKVFKQETFIFDLLAHADKAEVLLYPREETFAPLKTRDDLGQVQKALLERDRRAIEKLTGKSIQDGLFELHPSFHFPNDEHLTKWKDLDPPTTGYLEEI